jgi:hypothetical protein
MKMERDNFDVEAGLIMNKAKEDGGTHAKLCKVAKHEGFQQSILLVLGNTNWLSVLPSTLNGTALSAQAFQDALSMRHAEMLCNFPDKCNGCDAHFSLQQGLGCKKGGLMIFRHNEI